MSNWIKATLNLCAVFFLYTTAYPYSSTPLQSILEQMKGNEILRLTIDTDLDSIIAIRRKPDAVATSLSFTGQNGEQQTWQVNLTARGRFRRLHCVVPPLKLDFKKGDLRAKGLAEFDDFKLVTECVPNQPQAKELVIREYLAYKLYNELTAFSYRVQLVQITYRNLVTGKEDDQWGFLIEDTAELSARLGIESVESMALPIDSFYQEELRLVSVFQEMIGNPDWGINPSKNIKYFRKDGKIIPIVYDFDFSALVDAPYAKATLLLQDIPIQEGAKNQHTDLHPRVFGNEIESTLAYFQSKRKELINIVRKYKILSAQSRGEMIIVLDRFFRSSLAEELEVENMR